MEFVASDTVGMLSFTNL